MENSKHVEFVQIQIPCLTTIAHSKGFNFLSLRQKKTGSCNSDTRKALPAWAWNNFPAAAVISNRLLQHLVCTVCLAHCSTRLQLKQTHKKTLQAAVSTVVAPSSMHHFSLQNFSTKSVSSSIITTRPHAARFAPFFSFSTVTALSSMCHFSLHIFSTKSVLGSIITIPPRKFVKALANASTVSTSR